MANEVICSGCNRRIKPRVTKDQVGVAIILIVFGVPLALIWCIFIKWLVGAI